MENLEKSVSVLGFPQGLNKFKVKLFVEKQIGAAVKSVEKEGNLAIITFENFDDLRRFHNAGIKNINFGGSVHDLRILSDHEDEHIQQDENSSNKIIKQERKLLDCLTQETLFNNVHYWSDLPVLPAPEGTQCVLAQNISPSNSIQKMTLHFQNKRRNGGGPVKCFIQMVDGLLVVFNDIKNSESCLNTINQSLDGKKISIFRKVIPEYYTNKFVLEVIGESKIVDHETLELYLESCSPNETSPTSCNKQEKSGVYLIEYGDDFDYSETEDLLQKIHSKPLEGKSLKAAPLLKTDCLKVMGVTSDISNDAMRLLFESGKRTNGGPVTRIDRLKTQSALVYFCSYIVAGRVHQKLGGDMIICKHPVKFELYHHSVSNDHNDNIINFQQTSGHQQESGHVPEDQLGSFLLKPSCDEAIFHFISGNRSHAEKLQQIFINIAEVKFMSQPDLQLEFTPLKDCKESKENFNKYCEKDVNKFLSEYATVSCTFEQSKLERARSYNLYPEIEQTHMKSTNSENVIVCWKSNEPVVQITGLKSSVEQMSKQIGSHVNSVVVRTQSNQRQFKTYCYCGIVDEIRKMYPDVKIEIDEKIFLLQLTGLESMVYTANMQAMTMLNEIDKKNLTGLDESVISFILEFLSPESDLDVKLHKNFESAGIKGVIERSGDKLCLKVKPNEDYKKAVEVIEQFIIVEEIVTDEAASRVVTSSSSWREFQKKLQKGLCSIHIKSNKNIVITGLREDLDLLKVKIKKFLDENSDGIFVGGKKRAPDIEAGHVTEDQLCPVVLKPSCDEAIYNFISGNRSHAEKLKQLFINIAEVKFMYQPDFQLEFTPLKDCKESKENFFTHCEKNVNKFLSEYATVSCTFEQSRLDRARSQDLYPEIEKRYKRKANSDDIIVCWKSNEPVVQITGLKSSVEQMSKQIENHVNSVVVRTQNNESQFRTYCYCGIVDEIRKMYPDVKIDIDEKNFSLELTGLESMVYTANMQAMTMLNEIDRNQLTGLDGSIISFILEFLSPESDLDMKLHNNFKSAGIKGVIERNGDKLCLKVKPNKDYKKAVEVIKQFIIVEEIETDETESKVVTSSSWRGFQQKLQKRLYSICIKPNKSIMLTGLSDELELLKVKIKKFLNENSIKKIFVPMAYGRARYIFEQFAEISEKSCENTEIECGLTPENGGGIFVKGKQHVLDTAIPEIQDLHDNILEFKHCLNEPGNRQYYQSSDGLRFIKSTELLIECIILTISRDCEEWVKYNKQVYNPTGLATAQSSAVSSPPQSPNAGAKSKKRSSSFQYKKIDGNSASFGPLVVSVYRGDITSEDSDVIVNSTNSQFDLGVGMVSQQILAKGGSVIQDEALKGSGFEYRVTSGGNLPCKKIIQLVTPSEPNDLQKKIVKLLQEVENLHLSSVSIPALGTGNLGLDTLTVGAIIRDSIEKFISLNRSINYLDTINIIVWENAKLKPFKDAILNKHPKKDVLEKWLGFGNGIQAWFTGSLSEEKVEDSSFWMFFYATNQEEIDKAIGYISHGTGKAMKEQIIDDDVIGRLTNLENFEIDEIRKTRNVRINNTSNGYLNRLVFIGLNTEVTKALLQVKEILRKLCDAENCAAYVTWQKKTSNNWENYLPRTAHVLEKAYQTHLKKKTTDAPEKVEVPEYKKGAVTHHSIDISSLFDQNNQSPPKVRRQPTERSASDLPASWDEMKKGTLSTRIILQNGSQEYQNVLTKSQAGGVFYSTIVSIERIQNISLYKQYIAKKAEVTKKIKNVPKQIEQQLFHGTGNDDDILIHGFDRSYAGKHATAFGRGVYFATRASYSHGYAAPKQNGHRRMFLADVITGDYCAGNANFVAPPNRANTNLKNDLYDSVVDNVMAPTIYVIFKDSSAYPTYLITYK